MRNRAQKSPETPIQCSVDPDQRQIELVVDSQSDGMRLDQFLSHEMPTYSRAAFQRWIDAGSVLIDGRSPRRSHRVATGASVFVTLPEFEKSPLIAEDIPLSVIFEDDDVLVVDKPAGMVVHPAPGHSRGTLANAVLGHVPELNISGTNRPGIVHRLDRDTSGVIVVAKSDHGQRSLLRQWQDRSVEKHYVALVTGQVEGASGTVDAPIARDQTNRLRMAVREGGREAVTDFAVVRRFDDSTLLDVEPVTGRTHQIRVHLAFAGYPVVGDAVYNLNPGRGIPLTVDLSRQFLHAAKLSFHLPSSAEVVSFDAPLPTDLKVVVAALERGDHDE